jgi:hypothetical protein
MRTTIFVAAALLATSAARASSAATITLASGEIVEGEIQGRLLIKRGPDPDFAYRIVEGRDVTSITAAGIACGGETVIVMSLKTVPAAALLKALKAWDEGRQLKTGQGTIRNIGRYEIIGFRKDNQSLQPIIESLLGDYRVFGDTLDPSGSIRVSKSDGSLLTLSVGDIVSFVAPQ